MYDGRIVRELEGAEITETNIIASALNIEAAAPAACAQPGPPMLERSRHQAAPELRLRHRASCCSASSILLYHWPHPKGFSSAVLVQNGDEVFALAMVAMAQTVPVLTAASTSRSAP